MHDNRKRAPLGPPQTLLGNPGFLLTTTNILNTFSGPHHLLEQVPLTVSPFVNLPTATTLPYTYKQMPTTLPPSTTDAAGPPGAAGEDGEGGAKPKFVVSASGHAAHPDDIMASCRALAAHIASLQADAERELRDLDESIKARELAEKRRVAPGWLDSDNRLLQPERAPSADHQLQQPGLAGVMAGLSLEAQQPAGTVAGVSEMAAPDQGAELDRAFGGLTFGK